MDNSLVIIISSRFSFLGGCRNDEDIPSRKSSSTLHFPSWNLHRNHDFSDANSLFDALSKISKQELVDACVGFDPYLQKVRMQRESIASDLKKLAGVMKDNNSVIGALKDSAKIAVSGRRYMDDVKYSGHFVIEERTKEAAIFACEEVNRICCLFIHI